MRRFFACAVGTTLFLGFVAPAGAEMFTVTHLADPTPGTCDFDDCSLCEAVIAAKTNGEDDVINLPTGMYELARIANGALDLTESYRTFRIQGAGADRSIIDAGKDRVSPPPLRDRLLRTSAWAFVLQQRSALR